MKKYKNRTDSRVIRPLRATWYYLGQLAEQMGMSTEEYAVFALQMHVCDRRDLLDTKRKWADEEKQ